MPTPPVAEPPAGARPACLLLNAAGLTGRRLTEAGLDPTVLDMEVPPALALTPAERAHLDALRSSGFVAAERERAARAGCTMIDLRDPAYPDRLRQIADPPLVLYVDGDPAWLAKPSIGIVGSRNATLYGRSAAEALASQLALRGLVITSGFARGIDAAAHGAAIRSGGATIAVLGGGLDIPYPRGHEALRAQVAAHGCRVTEFPFGMNPTKATFPRRNRVISGLSLGVIVVEAMYQSGALITARFAMEQGREVFAVPGNIFSAASQGPHQLLRDGAKLTATAGDVLEELAGVFTPAALASPAPGATPGTAEAAVVAALGAEPVHVDDLARRLALPMTQLMPVLSILELKRCVRQHPGKRFSLP